MFGCFFIARLFFAWLPGPFDARVEYYCAFLPALVESAPHLPVIGAEPARYARWGRSGGEGDILTGDI